MSNNKQLSSVEWLVKELNQKIDFIPMSKWDEIKEVIEQAKEMEKEQSIELIKQTAMFMAASHLDKDIANMSYEDVYKTYYNETVIKID